MMNARLFFSSYIRGYGGFEMALVFILPICNSFSEILKFLHCEGVPCYSDNPCMAYVMSDIEDHFLSSSNLIQSSSVGFN